MDKGRYTGMIDLLELLASGKEAPASISDELASKGFEIDDATDKRSINPSPIGDSNRIFQLPVTDETLLRLFIIEYSNDTLCSARVMLKLKKKFVGSHGPSLFSLISNSIRAKGISFVSAADFFDVPENMVGALTQNSSSSDQVKYFRIGAYRGRLSFRIIGKDELLSLDIEDPSIYGGQ